MITLYRIYNIGALVCFVGMMACVLFEVVARDILQFPTAWAEELSRFLFVWTVFLGSAAAWHRGVHIVIDVLPRRLRGWPKKLLMSFIHGSSAVFLICLWIGAVQIMKAQYPSKTTALEISIAWFYLGLFMGTTGMIIFHFQRIIRYFTGKEEKSQTSC